MADTRNDEKPANGHTGTVDANPDGPRPLERLRRKTVALIPLTLLLGAFSRYAELRSSTPPTQRSAIAFTVAFGVALVAALAGGVPTMRGRTPSPRVRTTRHERVAVLAMGTSGIAVPAAILAWSRGILNQNSLGIALLVPALVLAACERKARATVAATIAAVGTTLLIVGRTSGLGLPPARTVYLSIVSGGIIDIGRAAGALGGLLFAGVLTAHFYRRIHDDVPGGAVAIALLLGPAAALLAVQTILLPDEAPGNVDAWSIASGFAVLVATISVLTLVRRTTPFIGATTALAAFLPAVVVTVRSQDTALTPPMRVGAVLIVTLVLLLRRAVRTIADGETARRTDR